MMALEIYIALTLVGISLIFYTMLDGYDIGIGIMLPFQPKIKDQRVLVNLVTTTWDGNESWIILIGTLLWGAFPGVYASVLPQSYIAFFIMLMGFFIRVFSIEFQGTFKQFSTTWRYVFVFSSWLIVIPQGMIVGHILMNFLNPVIINKSLFITLIVLLIISLYCINGMNWQYIKSVRSTKKNAVYLSRILIIIFLLVFSAILFCILKPGALLISLSTTRSIMLFIVAGLIYFFSLFMFSYYSFKIMQEKVATFYAALFLDLLLVIAVGLLMFPYINPQVLITDITSPAHSSVRFIVIGVGLCMPIVLWYNRFAYNVFKGKQKFVIKD